MAYRANKTQKQVCFADQHTEFEVLVADSIGEGKALDDTSPNIEVMIKGLG